MRYSYSMLDAYAKCPKQAYHKYIARDTQDEPPSDAQIKGNAVHKALELAVLNKTPLPEPYNLLEPFLAPLRGRNTFPETRFGLDETLQACEPEVAFFISIVDILVLEGDRAVILDWKTGKPRDNTFQLQTYALQVLKHRPEVQAVTAANLYTRTGKSGQSLHVTRADEDQLEKTLAARIFAVEKSKESGKWPKRPSPLCAYCPVVACSFNPKGNHS